MPRQKSTHVDSPKAVGERLKAARERAGLSQRQLSFPGCSPAYISRIESGDRIPSLQLLRELGRRLNVTEDFLATGNDTPFERGSALLEAEVLLRLNDLDAAEDRVGVDTAGRAHFVISEGPVSFGKLARYFRDVLKTPDALYLDGSVSALWDPATGRMDARAPIGPMIVIEEKPE